MTAASVGRKNKKRPKKKQKNICVKYWHVNSTDTVMNSVLLVFSHYVLSFSVVLDNEPHYMTSYNLVFYCSIKKETIFAIMCVRILCHGYQICVCRATPNEHIRLGLCQRLSVTSCRLVYSEWQ